MLHARVDARALQNRHEPICSNHALSPKQLDCGVPPNHHNCPNVREVASKFINHQHGVEMTHFVMETIAVIGMRCGFLMTHPINRQLLPHFALSLRCCFFGSGFCRNKHLCFRGLGGNQMLSHCDRGRDMIWLAINHAKATAQILPVCTLGFLGIHAGLTICILQGQPFMFWFALVLQCRVFIGSHCLHSRPVVSLDSTLSSTKHGSHNVSFT